MIPLDTLGPLFSHYGLWLVAAASVIEGPIVTVLSTALAHKGILPIWPLAVILLAGDLVGDALHYALGRRGLAKMPRPWRRWLGLGPSQAAHLSRHFDQHGGKTLVLAKLTHSVGTPVLIAAGMARMPFWSFLGWNALAALPKIALLMALGWYAGDAWRLIETWLGRWTWVLLLILAVIAALWLARRRAWA